MSWGTRRLSEFVAGLADIHGEAELHSAAAEGVALALRADAAALARGGELVAATGAPLEPEARAAIMAAQGERPGAVAVDSVASCSFATASVADDPPSTLLVARFDSGEFAETEIELLRAMARMLALALRNAVLFERERQLRERTEAQALENARLLETLQERHILLERLSSVQREIGRRTALGEVLDSIVSGAFELLGDETVGLRLICDDDPGLADSVSTIGVEGRLLEERRAPVGEGAGGLAIASGELVAMEDYGASPAALPAYAEDGLQAAMAAPIFERGEVAGSLVVATYRVGRTYSEAEREMLTAFAEHAGLALNDARTVADTVHQAFHDSLTGLPNRARFLDELEGTMPVEVPERRNVAVLFCDLDGFKTVNDSLGHAAGDQLLVKVAKRLQGCLEPGDIAARFGGDEFAILLDEVADERAPRRAAERVLQALEDPFTVSGREVFVTTSIGIASGVGEPDRLLRNADLAMYQAKSRGKGRYEVFEPGMHAAIVERLELEVDLKRALERDEFVLDYQPVCELPSRQIRLVEALVRWNHPQRGLVGPDDFIPLAEESHQVLALGRWVMREACRQGALWHARYPAEPDLRVSVNVSGVQLEQPDFVDQVSRALGASGFPAASLVLEFTETVLMGDSEANVAKLEALKGLGVQLAVDDFGTGYSSLEYLRRFRIDILKIAKSFVDGLDVEPNEEAQALVRAIVDLAASFHLEVIAEGIERPGQLARLIEVGPAMGQGFLFAGPMSAAELDSLLLTSELAGGAVLGGHDRAL